VKRALLLLATIALSGCLDLDGIWFNGLELDTYEVCDESGENCTPLPHTDDPAYAFDVALLEEVELEGAAIDDEGAPSLTGFWLHQCPEGAQGEDCGTARDDVKVLYLHGNFHNMHEYTDRLLDLWKMGYPVFGIDYRGYGKSTGTSSEAGFFADGLTAYEHVLERMDADDVLLIYGFSIGSAVATEVAQNQAHDVFVLEAPLASGQAFVDDAIGVGFDQSVLMHTEFDNLEKIPDIDTPKLLMHGRNDDFVRFQFGELLFEAAVEPKAFHANEGAHGTVPCPSRDPEPLPSELPCVAEDEYVQVLDDFVADALNLSFE
jgi:pimeloyl-ACP methyl ester carboxylesterase